MRAGTKGTSNGTGSRRIRRCERTASLEALEGRVLMAAGALDVTFSGGGKVVTPFAAGADVVSAVVPLAGGKFLAVGTSRGDFAVARFNGDGTLDATFGGGDGKVTASFGGNDSAAGAAALPGGKFVVAGTTARATGRAFAVARFNADGSPDRTFGGDGKVTTGFGLDAEAAGVAAAPGGKVVVAGTAETQPFNADFAAARYNPDGSLDKTFGGDGRVTTDFGTRGSPDSDTYEPGIQLGGAVAVQADGKVLVAGSAHTLGDSGLSAFNFAVARYTAGGAPDATFGGGAGYVTTGFNGSEDTLGADDFARAITLLPGGKFLVAGGATDPDSGTSDFAAARYNANGSIDTSFGTGGRVLTNFSDEQEQGSNDEASAALVGPGGAIILAGSSDSDFAVARYTPSGQLDRSFSGDGKATTDLGASDEANAAALLTNGRLLLAGGSRRSANDADFALAAYELDPADANDQLSEAASLPVGSRRTQEIYPRNDVDLYRFTVTAGQRVAFDVDAAAPGALDSYLRIFDGAGAELASNDDAAGPGEAAGKSSYLEYTFAAAGTYYVGVSGKGNSSYSAVTGAGDREGSGGGYTLTLSEADRDPDNQIREALPLAMNSSRSGDLSGADDAVDMYKFNVVAGQSVLIDLSINSDGLWDIPLRLLDGTGRELARSEFDSIDFDQSGVPIYYTFPAAGTYYVAVPGFENDHDDPVNGGGEPGGGPAYTLTLTNVPSDSNDQIAEAVALAVGSSTTREVSPAVDVDLYKFTVTAGQSVAFDAYGVDADLRFAPHLRVFSATGAVLAQDVSSVAHTFSAAGTYYIGVSGDDAFGGANDAYDPVTGAGKKPGRSGGYRLQLRAVGLASADADDQISEATPITVGGPSLGQHIDFGTDVDMYRFTVSAGRRVSFRLDDLDEEGPRQILRVFDSAGRELSFASDDYTFAAGGTYYVGVSGEDNFDYDPVRGSGDEQAFGGYYRLVLS